MINRDYPVFESYFENNLLGMQLNKTSRIESNII